MPALDTIPSIRFGEWRPDVARLGSAHCSIALNVVPLDGGWGPWDGFEAFSSSVLDGNCLGAVYLVKTDGTWVVYAGTATKLYRQTASSGGWVDVTRSAGGAYAATSYWRFALFGAKLVAVNSADAPQVIDIDSGSNFAALGGSPPTAADAFTVGDFLFLVLAGNRRKMRWSAINDVTGWTVGTNLCDEQEFPDGGNITGITGDKSGYVLQEQGVRTFQFLPGDTATIFEFARRDGIPGCPARFGWALANGVVYYWSEQGFFALTNAGAIAIGAQRVDRHFRASFTRLMIAAADPFSNRIVWSLPESLSIIYDYVLNRWSKGFSPGFLVAAVGTTVAESAPSGLAAIDITNIAANRTLNFQTGDAMPGAVATSDLELIHGRRTNVTKVYPITDGTSVTVTVFAKDNLKSSTEPSETVGTEDTVPATTGWHSLMASGRFLRFGLSVIAPTFIDGIKVAIADGGET